MHPKCKHGQRKDIDGCWACFDEEHMRGVGGCPTCKEHEHRWHRPTNDDSLAIPITWRIVEIGNLQAASPSAFARKMLDETVLPPIQPRLRTGVRDQQIAFADAKEILCATASEPTITSALQRLAPSKLFWDASAWAAIVARTSGGDPLTGSWYRRLKAIGVTGWLLRKIGQAICDEGFFGGVTRRMPKRTYAWANNASTSFPVDGGTLELSFFSEQWCKAVYLMDISLRSGLLLEDMPSDVADAWLDSIRPANNGLQHRNAPIRRIKSQKTECACRICIDIRA